MVDRLGRDRTDKQRIAAFLGVPLGEGKDNARPHMPQRKTAAWTCSTNFVRRRSGLPRNAWRWTASRPTASKVLEQRPCTCCSRENFGVYMRPKRSGPASARFSWPRAEIVFQAIQRLQRWLPPRSVRLPARFLRHLRVGLRLFLWELQGFFFHREVGLGKARDVIQDAFLSLDDADADPTALSRTVLRLSVERFAWNGPGELGAEVALDDALEDAALDALAAYLWACRPPVPTTPGPLP